MATTISCEVLRAGAAMPRASINGHQFIECDVMRAGARTPDAKIGSKAQVLNVKAWTHPMGLVPHGNSVELNLEALNTAEKDLHYDDGTSFLTGTFDDTEPVGDALNLVTSPSGDDFEGYTVGQNPTGNGWTSRTTTSGWSIRADVADSVQQVKQVYYNKKNVMTLDSAGAFTDVDLKVRVRFANSSNSQVRLTARVNGSGNALSGYVAGISVASYWFYFGYYNGLDGRTGGIVVNWNFGFTPVVDEWYWIRWRIIGTTHYFKVWKDGEAETESWFGKGDTRHQGAGDVGLMAQTSVASEVKYFDDFSAEGIPPTYQTSGTWEDSVDVSAVDHFSHGQVTWDEVTPANTTAAVKYRWRSSDAWATLNNGAVIPNIEYEQDMRAGATKDTLEFRVELATTDTGVTPAVSNLRVYFEPGRDEAFKVTVHGVENVIEDQSLVVWGREWLTAGVGTPFVEALDWSDLSMLTGKQWIARDLQTVTAAFSYWGNAIESITFDAEGSKYRQGYGTAEWVVPVLARESGLTRLEWTALSGWSPMGHNYEWNIIDQGQAIHADARWICGHIQIDDNPGSLLAGLLVLDDNVGSLIAKGYLLNDNIGQAVVQGWRRDDAPGSFLSAEEFLYDTPGSLILAVRELHDQPGMFLVYGVNREGSIFVNVIDDNTYQTLTDFGVTFS